MVEDDDKIEEAKKVNAKWCVEYCRSVKTGLQNVVSCVLRPSSRALAARR